MSSLEEQFINDVERIQSLTIVPSILEIICRTTGMGFSAVARVTEQKWIACAVRDEINFGLKPGGELQIETTICNEIREHGRPVVIDEVSCDEQFRDHHTPAMYGFQSYISIPIILKDGSFFGTLCAIDPKPFALKASNMVAMFNLFADLISYHLLTQEKLSESKKLLTVTESKLKISLEDNRQYSFISQHTLREPLRKLQLFTDLLVTEHLSHQNQLTKTIAGKINNLAKDFSTMIDQISRFSEISTMEENFQAVDLNEILVITRQRLQLTIIDKNARIECATLPTVPGMPNQLGQMFYCLLENALNFSRPDVSPVIKIFTENCQPSDLLDLNAIPAVEYCKICIVDNGIGIESSYLRLIFDLFSKLNPRREFEGLGMGLSQSKRIVANHNGAILVQSQLNVGSQFSIILPVNRVAPEPKSLNEVATKETMLSRVSQ